MPSDIKIVYAEVHRVATLLRQAREDLVPVLNEVRDKVTELLSSEGGLWLLHSSSVLDEKYKNFTGSMTQAIDSIPMWANQFENIITQIEDMDRQMAEASKA